MRKQYHFRASPAGLRAWDVDRLIELAKGLPRQRVPLASIREIDEPYWSNEGTTQLTCRDVVEHARLMQDCDFQFPVILSRDGRVMDGMHRICKALLLGHEDIEAVRFVDDPQRTMSAYIQMIYRTEAYHCRRLTLRSTGPAGTWLDLRSASRRWAGYLQR